MLMRLVGSVVELGLWVVVFVVFVLYFFWFRLSVLVLVPICRWCRSVMFLFVDGEGAIIATCRPQIQDVTCGGVDILC